MEGGEKRFREKEGVFLQELVSHVPGCRVLYKHRLCVKLVYPLVATTQSNPDGSQQTDGILFLVSVVLEFLSFFCFSCLNITLLPSASPPPTSLHVYTRIPMLTTH